MLKNGLTCCLAFCALLSGCQFLSGSGLSSQAPEGPQVSFFYNNLKVAGQTGNLVADSHGNIYYPNINGWVIEKIDSNGNQTVFAGSGADAYTDGVGTGASFYAPYLIAIDQNDNLFVADGFKIRKVTSSAVVTTVATMPDGGVPRGITADSSGNVYFVWDDNGVSTHTIKKITSGGTITTFAGSGNAGYVDDTGTAAELNSPADMVTDSSGNIYVADTGNYRMRKVSPSGVVTTFAGSGNPEVQDGFGTSASFGFFDGYAHMAMDPFGNIYIGDMTGIGASRTDVIRKLSPNGTVTTYCGSENWNSSIGSCPEISAVSRFGVAVAADGTVYFADVDVLFKISN
jgi:hypothetical protein